MKLLTILLKKKPSPTYANRNVNPAQDSQPKSMKKQKEHMPLKRTPPYTSQKYLKGSMSVEASIVLPICIFFLLNLGSALELIRLHNRLQLALYEAGTKAAIYGCELKENLAVSIITDLYLQNAVISFCGEEYLKESPITGGTGGLRFLESDFFEDDVLDIKLTYEVSPLSAISGFKSFRMANRFVMHRWNGYSIPKEADEQRVVYVAQYGDVYHTDRNCSHLRIVLQAADVDDLVWLRNERGAKYTKCLLCAAGSDTRKIYLTSDGDSYHASATCSGLKRTVRAVPVEEAAGYRICERCEKRERGESN